MNVGWGEGRAYMQEVFSTFSGFLKVPLLLGGGSDIVGCDGAIWYHVLARYDPV